MSEPNRRPDHADRLFSRREILRGGLRGAAGLAALPAGLAALPAVLAGCSPQPTLAPLAPTAPPKPSAIPTPRLTGQLRVTRGLSYFRDADLARVVANLNAVDAAFAADTGMTPALRNVDDMQRYLTSDPDDVCFDSPSYHPGWVLQTLSAAGRLAPIDGAWDTVKGDFGGNVAEVVTGKDGHVYGMPFDVYPWLFFYRKSVWASKGYEVPTTWTELLALCKKMQSDGLTPISFGNKDGWPAFGFFDMVNLRLNGRDFHVGLLAGSQKWTDPRVVSLFETLRALLPYCTGKPHLVTWQEAARSLFDGTAGMFYMGLFLTGEFDDPALADDVDFFEFPYFGNEWDAEKAIEAPVDIVVAPARSSTRQADLANANAYLDFWARSSTQLIMCRNNPGRFPTARGTDTAQLDRLSRKAFDLVARAGHITQFFDRDTRPDFPSLSGAFGGYLQGFVVEPGRDLTTFLHQVQTFWDAMPPFEADMIS